MKMLKSSEPKIELFGTAAGAFSDSRKEEFILQS